MGHNVQGFLARKEILEPLIQKFGHSRLVQLEQSFYLLPLSPKMYDSIPGTDKTNVPSDRRFLYLSRKIGNVLLDYSMNGTLLYFETDYAGGVGNQCVVVVERGAMVIAPECGPDSINRGLRMLGIVAKKESDEFETVGLGRFRDTEDWLNTSD